MTNTPSESTFAGTRGLLKTGGTIAAILCAAIAMLPAQAQAAACLASITACGCTITTSQTYIVTTNLNGAGKPVCITVAAGNLTLNLAGNTLDGGGSATNVGIKVLATTAKGAAISNVKIISVAPSNAVIQHFGTGLLSAAAATTIDCVNTNNNGRGMVLNAPTPVVIDGDVSSNTGAGIQLNSGAVGAALISVTSDSSVNGPGIWLNGASGAYMTNITATGNKTFGAWLQGAQGSTLYGFTTNNNGLGGVYLGCAAKGPNLTTCASMGRSPTRANTISGDLFGGVIGVADPLKTQKWGVTIGLGNGANHVFDAGGSGNAVEDAFDENANCGSDLWFGTSFGTKSPAACIH